MKNFRFQISFLSLSVILGAGMFFSGCYGETGVSSKFCKTEGEIACRDNNVVSCDATANDKFMWSIVEECGENYICREGSCKLDSDCGNGVIDGPEVCDGTALGGRSCVAEGFYGGVIQCSPTCDSYDVTGCSGVCGDDLKTGDEECDGIDIGLIDCTDFGKYSGTLSCNEDCTINTTACYGDCGDGIKNGEELCDGTDVGTLTCEDYDFAGGTLTCDANCNPTTDSCMICYPGDYHCDGNEILECDGTSPGNWVSRNPAVVCDSFAGQKCNASTGTCEIPGTVGSTTPTGTFYQYAVFNSSNSPYLGGYDIAAHGNYIYINRQGQYLDVYRVDIADSDGDGVIDANQHPDNTNDQGPMEARTLVFIATFNKNADNVPVGGQSSSEMWADATGLYSLGPSSSNGDVTYWDFNTHQTTVVADQTTNNYLALLGWGEVDQTWFGAAESPRRIYSWHAASHSWVVEFNYPDLNGAHMDGLSVVKDPNTDIQYVYVTDMTSDFIGQYRRDGNGGWVMENLFQYNDSTGSSVEGMEFGPFRHFWVSAGGLLYEIGGGDFTRYLEKDITHR